MPSRFTFKDWRFWARLLAWDPLDTWNLLKLYTKRATGHMDNEWYGFVIPEGDAKLRKEHRNWARLTLLGHATLAAGRDGVPVDELAEDAARTGHTRGQ